MSNALLFRNWFQLTAARRRLAVLTQDGQIIKPEHNGTAWQLNGQIIQANLPECNPADNVKNGLEIGWLVFGVMAACYFVIVIKRMLK